MGSSNNFYQQALHENKLLQMKILELKHKAALYEVCLGSIASILKDLPLQQNINDTKLSQNAALHKIANVLTHIESVVKSNSEAQLHRNPAHNLSHNPLHQHPSKVQFAWAGNNNAIRRPQPGPRFPSTEMHLNSTHIPSMNNLVHGEPSGQPFNKAGSPLLPVPLESHEYPHHVSTLSIHKCMKTPETHPHTVGAMTISPITISQNFPIAIRRPIPVSLPKPVLNWPPTPGGSHFVDRKRALPRDAIFDELVRKKAAATATMESAAAAAAQDLQTNQKAEDQTHHVYRHTIEHVPTNQHQKNDSSPKNDTVPPHPMMMVQSGNPFLQEKRSHHQQMLNGGNIIINMNKVSSTDASPKWHLGMDCCNNNCNGNGKSNPNVVVVPAPSHSQSQPLANQPRKNIQVTRILPTVLPNTPTNSVTNSATQNEHANSDCTIIN